MYFDFNKTSKNIKIIKIKTIEKFKYSFIIKIKSRFLNFKSIFKEFILKKFFILKLKNKKVKFKKFKILNY